MTFAFYQSQRTAVLVERTYEEMVASGALATMADREFSSAIAGTFSELRNYKDFVTDVRVSLPVIDQVLWRHLDLSYDEQGVPTLSNFDFEAAWKFRGQEIPGTVYLIGILPPKITPYFRALLRPVF